MRFFYYTGCRSGSSSDDDVSETNVEEDRTFAPQDLSVVNQQTTKTGKKRKDEQKATSNIKKRRTTDSWRE